MSKENFLLDDMSDEQLIHLRAELRLLVGEWRVMAHFTARACQLCKEVNFRMDPLLKSIQHNAGVAEKLYMEVDERLNRRVRQS